MISLLYLILNIRHTKIPHTWQCTHS